MVVDGDKDKGHIKGRAPDRIKSSNTFTHTNNIKHAPLAGFGWLFLACPVGLPGCRLCTHAKAHLGEGEENPMGETL